MAYMAQIRNVLAQVAARQAEINATLAPSAALTAVIKAMQSPYAGIVTQLAAAMQREQQLYAEAVTLPKAFDEVAMQISRTCAMTDAITAPCRAVQEVIRSQSRAMEAVTARMATIDAMKLSAPQFSQAALAWTVASSGLANQMEEIGLLAQRQSLAARLFEAPRAYTSFIQHTTDLIVNAESTRVASLLRASMSLAEDQLVGIADTLNRVLVVPEDMDAPDSPRQLDAPYVQQNELLLLTEVGDETDAEAISALVASTQEVALSRRVLELVAVCNEAAKTSSTGVEIFKPTTRLLSVFSDLPWVLPRDKSGFGEVVDCLYFIFYEGAGKDHLRFLDKYGGPLTEDDCDLIWCIKHLRNKWSRHDADHGSDRDIRKSWAELTSQFRWLGLAQFPSSPEHFQQLHRNLLESAIMFLETIVARIRLG